ncbi:MAG: nucleotidyltransferase [Verrucomicrobia bacterium]|nr:MAG: nucleotidyltransferase [Verrucomicrobiota bacterium]
MPNEKTLVILAAGMGSRFGGLKQVHPAGPSGELIIDYSVYDAVRAGFSKVVAVIREKNESDFREAIGDRLSRHVPVEYAFQHLESLPAEHCLPSSRTKPWGTGQAALAAAGVTDTPFAVINADDFYGAGSYSRLAGFLDRADPSAPNYSLVGFTLRRTLSEAGAVSRGVCESDHEGYLKTVTERTRIIGDGNGIHHESTDGVAHGLSGDEVVSMNMWGFTPAVFPQLENRFDQFLKAGRGADSGEFYLPEAINDLVDEGEATVQVLSTDEDWFGVTYREDLEGCQRAIRDRIETGVYPEKLWGG